MIDQLSPNDNLRGARLRSSYNNLTRIAYQPSDSPELANTPGFPSFYRSPYLELPIIRDEWCVYEAFILYECASTSAEFTHLVGGFTFELYSTWASGATATSITSPIQHSATTNPAFEAGGVTSGTVMVAIASGIVVGLADSSIIAMNCFNNATSPSTLKAGSWIRLTKVWPP